MRGHLPEMCDLLRDECAISPSRLGELAALMGKLRRTDALELEFDYVALFDRGSATSLHLFEHLHGDSRHRGPAMIDLGLMYQKAGLVLAEGELPDYLPAVREFVSPQPPREARAFLGEMPHIFNAIFGALVQRESADTPLAQLWSCGRAMRLLDGPGEGHLRSIARAELARARATAGSTSA